MVGQPRMVQGFYVINLGNLVKVESSKTVALYRFQVIEKVKNDIIFGGERQALPVARRCDL